LVTPKLGKNGEWKIERIFIFIIFWIILQFFMYIFLKIENFMQKERKKSINFFKFQTRHTYLGLRTSLITAILVKNKVVKG